MKNYGQVLREVGRLSLTWRHIAGPAKDSGSCEAIYRKRFNSMEITEGFIMRFLSL